MKIHTRAFAPSKLAPFLVLLASLGASSCVTKARYDDVTNELRYYQRLYQDLESFQGELESENARLEGELELYRSSGTIEAAATADIDERMQELSDLAGRIGAGAGEVTVLSVEGGYGLRMPDSIVFESGSATILPRGRELLLKMAEEIKSRPYARIWVRGHTDSDPVIKPATKERFPFGNLQLSAARALEVANLLSSEAGIDRDSLVVAGFGPSDPVASNTSAEGKQRNRRVEIFVMDQEQGSPN